MLRDDVPLTVQKQIADNDTWWKFGQRSTTAQFLSEYSLHDSYMKEIDFSYFGMCHVLLKWDTAWIDPQQKLMNLDVISFPDGRQMYSREPYLCILFSSVHQIISNHHETVMDNGISRATTSLLSFEQRSVWLDLFSNLTHLSEETGSFLLDDNVHCTTFTGHGKIRHLHIIHSEPTFFLCLKEDGSLLQIPDLAIQDTLS